MCKIISVVNNKGGCGKTTTTICLANQLQIYEFDVLVVDTDSQCNTTTFYGAKTYDTYTMMDIMCADVNANLCIQRTSVGDIIPSDKCLKNVDIKILDDSNRLLHLKRSMANINKYDYVIIDTPPQLSIMTLNALASSDFILLPTDESGWSINGIFEILNVVKSISNTVNPSIKLAGLLITKAHPYTRVSKEISNAINKLFAPQGLKAFNTKIRESVACREAISLKAVPLAKFAPNSNTCVDYKKFTDELLEVING